MQRRIRGRLLTLVKIAAGVAVLVYLLEFVEWSEVAASARSAAPGLLIIALLLLPLNLLLEVVLWHRLVRTGGAASSGWDSLIAVLCGHSAGIATPARSGEVVVRALYAGDGDVWRAGALAVVHRILDLQAAALVGVPACVYFTFEYGPRPMALWWTVCAVGFAIVVLTTALISNPGLLQRLAMRWLRSENWTRRLEFLSDWPRSERWALLVLAGIRYLVYSTQFAILLHAFGGGASWPVTLLAGAVVFFAKLLVPPVTFTDVGIREGVAVYVGGFLSIVAATAFNAAFTLFVINLVLPALMGAPLFVRARRRADLLATAPEPLDNPR